MKNNERSKNAEGGGGELALAGMDEWSRLKIGRETYLFVKRMMEDPELRDRIKRRAAEIRASGEYK